MQIDNKYGLAETVYLKTDPDQLERIITGIKICITKELLYELSCGSLEVTFHYEQEIAKDKRVF